jgi:hypothetical protein
MYTLQGKTGPTRHTHPTFSPCMVPDHTYLTRSTHSNSSRSHQQSWAGPLLPRKRAPDIIHSTTASRSAGPYPVSLPSQPMKQWGQSQYSVDGWLLGLPGPYHGMRSVRSILAHGANLSVINWHRWGLQSWRYRLPTYHSPTFLTSDLHFPPNGSARS